MSFNTPALHSYPLVVPVPRSERPEPFRPHRGRASTVIRGSDSQTGRDVLGMSRTNATKNFQPHAFSREYSSIWNDVEVQNDWALAARDQGTSYYFIIRNVMD